MSDDWRLRIELAESEQASELTDLLQGGTVEHELDAGFSQRAIISVDEREVFVYTGTREQAERAADAIRSLAAQHGWTIDERLMRWHPIAEEWEDPDAPLPETGTQQAAERSELIEAEREESAEAGHPEWEVRVECHSHHDTVALAEKLNGEGIPNVRRWRFLLVGATDEAAAGVLAARLRDEVPRGSTVTVEESGAAVEATRPFNPFALFGGLAG